MRKILAQIPLLFRPRFEIYTLENFPLRLLCDIDICFIFGLFENYVSLKKFVFLNVCIYAFIEFQMGYFH